jgi:hypothetical protein
MKVILMSLVLICGLQASATGIEDIIGLIGGGNSNQSFPYPGEPGRPGRPGRPGYPGGRNEVCTANDQGYEEHRGGHFSCGECLQQHDNCIETCRSNGNIRCEAQGIDRRGRLVAFYGEAPMQRRAERQAYDACSYNARNCQVVRCDQMGGQETRRSCRF